MTEQELRLMIRDAIVRHRRSTPVLSPPEVSARLGEHESTPAVFFHQHTSHRMFAVPSGADSDGPCLIEPMVMCNHCGYCKSYGH
jgi:hypothetical protein